MLHVGVLLRRAPMLARLEFPLAPAVAQYPPSRARELISGAARERVCYARSVTLGGAIETAAWEGAARGEAP